MINWYRALFRHPGHFRMGQAEAPTRILWGRKDAFLHPSLADASLRKCADAQIIWFNDATHWVHLEEPERVNAFLIDFFSRPPRIASS
jgi:pimeloyl-ACP methyl ester carboxylesterase